MQNEIAVCRKVIFKLPTSVNLGNLQRARAFNHEPVCF